MTNELPQRQKRLFLASVCCSLFFHVLMLYLFQAHSLSAPPSGAAPKSNSPRELVDRRVILKEVFQNLTHSVKDVALAPQKMEVQEDLQQNRALLEVKAPEESLQAFLPSFSFHPSDLLSWNSSLPSRLSPPPSTLFPFCVDASLATFKAHQPKTTEELLSPSEQTENISLGSSPPPLSCTMPAAAFIVYEEKSLIQPPLLSEATIRKKASLAIPPPPLPSFPTLGELDTYSYSDSFDLDVVCSPRDDGKGYLFAATLIPHQDLTLPKIRQHYAFLIDRANSIQRERLLATKSAVLRALSELDPDDTFNIIVFDSKVEKAFPQNRLPSHSSLAEARAFLDKIQLGSFFSPADLYNPLFLTLPYPAKEEEIYTAILMTDGENLSKKNSMRSILSTWTMQNSGKICLYTLAMGGDPNLAGLDAASALNRGRLYSSPTKRGIRRKLLKLMKNIHSPIAKNLSARAISTSSGSSIELFPKAQNIPHLYLDQPIVILGSCEKLDDFILFVQGRCKDCWFNIKKNISFINAKKGGSSLRKEWALQQAYLCYENYTHDDNPEHLARARDLLSPFDIQPAFE